MRMEVYIVQLVLTFLLVFVFPILLFADNSFVYEKENISIINKVETQLSTTSLVTNSKKTNPLSTGKAGVDYAK